MTFRSRVAESRFARLAALPFRVSQVGRHDAHLLAMSARWLAQSKESTNYTYDITDRNREYLAWWVSGVSARPVAEVRGYFEEILGDRELAGHIRHYTATSSRSRLADLELRWHRHLGWYALVRALRPEHIVETGTDKGRGTLVLASAVRRNGLGRVTTIDNNPASGYLIRPPYSEFVTRIIGDSVSAIAELDTSVDFFLHDSLHTREHEAREFEAVAPRLSKGAIVLSDNAHATDVLSRWAESRGWHFTFFQERPAHHWYPGAGIGLASRSPSGVAGV